MDIHDGILLVFIFTYFTMTKQIYGKIAMANAQVINVYNLRI